MKDLSNELYLHILSYLEEIDQLEWCGCTRKWYDEILRGHIRKYRYSLTSNTPEEYITKWLDRLYQVIRKPSNQVEMRMHLTLFGDPAPSPGSQLQIFNRLFPALNYTLRKMSYLVNAFEVISLLELVESFQMAELELTSCSEPITEEALNKSFQKISGLQILSIDVDGNEYQVPYLPTLKALAIRYSIVSHPVHPSYFSQLEKLELIYSEIADVSMFGSIPDLTLKECHNITDISALNNNRRVSVDNCSQVQDFSQSFAETEIIFIRSTEDTITLSLQPEKWKKVKSLTLALPAILGKTLEIPLTVVKCQLQYGIVSSVNLTVSPFHALKELRIICDDKEEISSLENRGWERLRVIELTFLAQLSSLQGLGSGKNQKVIIRNCPLITDYSPLRYVHEVVIWNVRGQVHLDDLDHVHTLTIQANELIVNPTHCYDYITKLEFDMVDNISSFQGLERIPVISFNLTRVTALEEYLEMMGNSQTEREHALWNQRIDFIFGYEEEDEEEFKRVESLYHRFLASQYYFLNRRRRLESGHYRVSFLRRNELLVV